jgi:PucR family transcriptional regulator, purine catabolism regulatory protein
MPVTLTALVSQPALGLAVLATFHALEREISWVHTSELVDPTPYLTGGELVLSVGLWLGSGPAAEREAVPM